jgi:23S rRNA (pseudouridine1915-N3)-methyltransferase
MKDKRLRLMAEDYFQRLKTLWPVTLMEISGEPKKVSKFVDGKKGRGLMVSLDPHGEPMDSLGFGQWVTKSSRDIYFFAWGPDGSPQGLSKDFFRSLSLSPMTYSHEIARVLLMEQLYRAGASLKGHPYPR